MTENEVIKVIETEKQCVLRNNENGCDRDCICCDLVMAENDIICGYDTAIKALKEIQQYQAIGTVEECRKAMERQKSQPPNIWGDGYDKEGNIIYDMYDCPGCGQSYEIDDKYKYCPECGQAINWSGFENL